ESTMQKLQTELGRSASEPELAQAMDMSLEDFQHMLNEIRGLDVGSLQIESLEDGRETNLGETIPGPPNQDPLFLCMQGERRQLLADAIAQLPQREQQVLALYYLEELTMKEVGAVLGVGESRVSQIHSAAMVRLRARLGELMKSHTPAADRAAPKNVSKFNLREISQINKEQVRALSTLHESFARNVTNSLGAYLR